MLWITTLLCPALWAADVSERRAHAPLATTEVERSLILARGWMEVEVGLDVHAGAQTGGLNATEHVGFTYGISKQAALYARLPFHHAHVQDSLHDAEAAGFVDPLLGVQVEWFRKRAPTTSIISDLQIQVPVPRGDRYGDSAIASSSDSMMAATGVPSLGVELAAKHQLGPVAVTAGVASVHPFLSIVPYTIEMGTGQATARLKPGDQLCLRIETTLQVGPLAIGGELRYRAWSFAAMTPDVLGLAAPNALEPIPASGGWSLAGSPMLSVNVSRGVDLDFAMRVPLHVEDDSFYLLNPSRPEQGLIYSSALRVRF